MRSAYAAILRDAAKTPLLRTRVGVVSGHSGTHVFAPPWNDSGLFHERTRWLQVQRIGIDLVAGARIDFGHDRVVPGDDAIGMSGKTLDDFPPLEHVAAFFIDRK